MLQEGWKSANIDGKLGVIRENFSAMLGGKPAKIGADG